jgi:hypothetical protein
VCVRADMQLTIPKPWGTPSQKHGAERTTGQWA